MNGWSTSREPEKPKTLTGRRELAREQARVTLNRLQAFESAAELLGGTGLVKILRDVADTIRQLLEVLPGADRKV